LLQAQVLAALVMQVAVAQAGCVAQLQLLAAVEL
jgi:hypothetical protein